MDRQTLLLSTKGISLSAIRSYATTHGWKSVPGSKRRIWLFSHPDHSLVQLQIPMDYDEDTPLAILEVAMRIAAVEERPLGSVIEDLEATGTDILRLRAVSEELRGTSISFDRALGLLDGARQMLSSAACSVANPATYHSRTDRSEARQLLARTKMGQTEIGSFVLKLFCPLDAVLELPLLPEIQPFVRSTTTLVMNATSTLIHAIEQGTVDDLLEKQHNGDEPPLISSNFCKGLLDLKGDQTQGQVILSMTWGSLVHVPVPQAPSTIHLPVDYYPEIERVYHQLRPAKREDDTRQMIGTVETLNGDVGEDGKRSGEVILSLLLPDEAELVKAKVRLNSDDYLSAVQAHERGRTYIQLQGLLRRGDRIGRIDRPENFALIETKPTRHANE